MSGLRPRSDSFHLRLSTTASLKKTAAVKGMADDIRTVLRDAGIPETSDAVIAAGARRRVQ